jgi:PmbA protein
VNDAESESAKVTTNGFEGSYRGTSISLNAEVSVKDDDGRRPEDWASAATRHRSDLPDAKLIGREATERALARLGAKKIASGTTKLIVEARTARGLIRHLTSPLSGWALQQKESFFEGRLGKDVASTILTVTDDGTLVRGLASRPYDGEGMATQPRTIIDKGILRSYFIDVYYGSKLGMAPTSGGSTNLVVATGDKSLDALVKDVKDGILVTAFLGGNSNSTTGVFSLGIAGFRIAGGERKEPIGEMNLSGKHLEFWRRLAAVGNDRYPYSSTRSPSLVFDGVSVAGK